MNFTLSILVLGLIYICEIFIIVIHGVEQNKRTINKVIIGISAIALVIFVGVIIHFKRHNSIMMMYFLVAFIALFIVTVVLHIIDLKTKIKINLGEQHGEHILDRPRFSKIEKSENPEQEIKVNKIFKDLINKTEVKGVLFKDKITYVEEVKDVFVEYKKYCEMLNRETNFINLIISSMDATDRILEEFNTLNSIKNPRVNENKERIGNNLIREVEHIKIEVLQKIDLDILTLEKLK